MVVCTTTVVTALAQEVGPLHQYFTWEVYRESDWCAGIAHILNTELMHQLALARFTVVQGIVHVSFDLSDRDVCDIVWVKLETAHCTALPSDLGPLPIVQPMSTRCDG